MAPRKSKKKAAGRPTSPHAITRCAETEAKRHRIGELKVNFARVAKALRPALAEMAGRTSRHLDDPTTYHGNGRRRAQYDALVADLDEVRESNIARRVACHDTRLRLKAESVLQGTLQETAMIENRYRVGGTNSP